MLIDETASESGTFAVVSKRQVRRNHVDDSNKKVKMRLAVDIVLCQLSTMDGMIVMR